MPTWEYLFITCAPLGSFSTEWRPRYANGEEIKGWHRGDSLFEYANHRGSEGWEMVNTVIGYDEHGSVVDYRMIFKRAISTAVTTETRRLGR